MLKAPFLILLTLPTFVVSSAATADPAGTSGSAAVPGEPDPSFGGDGWVVTDEQDWGGQAQTMIQPDGRIVVAGSHRYQFDVWRFLPSGDLDASFGGDGRVTVDLPGREGAGLAAALQPDGKIVLAGYAGMSMVVARLIPDGGLDPSFGEGDGITMIRFPRTRGQAEDIELLADGRILLGGQVARSRPDESGFHREIGLGLALLTPLGVLDTSFGTDGRVRAPMLFADLTLDAQGVVVVGVDRRRPERFVVARYRLDGARNEAFAPGGLRGRSMGKRIEIYDGEVVVDGAGRIVLSITGTSRRCWLGYGAVVRLNADGTWDTTFSADGIALRGCRSASQLAIQGDGRIVIAGEVFSGAGSGEYLPVLARVGTDGTPDATFGDGGSFTPTPESDAFYWSSGTDVVLQQDGKILLLAQAIWEYSFALGRFLAA